MIRDETTVWEFTVQWGNPFTDPPDGQSRVIARTRVAVPRDAGAPEPSPEIIRAWETSNRAFACSSILTTDGVDHTSSPSHACKRRAGGSPIERSTAGVSLISFAACKSATRLSPKR